MRAIAALLCSLACSRSFFCFFAVSLRQLICSALYLKQQIPCPLREIEAQAQSGGKGPTLRKYRQYIDALNAVKQDLASLFQLRQVAAAFVHSLSRQLTSSGRAETTCCRCWK